MSLVDSLREIAAALGGEVSRGSVLAPGPGHSRRDRSLSIKLSFNSPDGFIVFSHAGDDFRECRDYVKSRLGLPQDGWRDRPSSISREMAGPDLTDETRIARAAAIWHEARDPRGTIAEHYLASRGLALDEVVSVAALRFHPACPWRDQDRQQTIRVPALVAAMRQVEGDRLTAVHRTRLTEDGRKVDRRMLGVAAGAAVKLDADDEIEQALVIGEGIETALSGRLLGFRPVWATGSAGAIAKLSVLSGVETLTILTERDETGANQRAVEVCGTRWHRAGRAVILAEPKFGKDMNDTLRGVA